VTPYTDDVQLRIGKVWAGEGIACHAERISVCAIISRSERERPAEIACHDPCRCRGGCDAIVILCTNMDGAGITDALERELNVLILDSVAVTLWRTNVACRADPRILSGWGTGLQSPLP
jgi:maleate isomerase